MSMTTLDQAPLEVAGRIDKLRERLGPTRSTRSS